jgi:hypothetical protein
MNNKDYLRDFVEELGFPQYSMFFRGSGNRKVLTAPSRFRNLGGLLYLIGAAIED